MALYDLPSRPAPFGAITTFKFVQFVERATGPVGRMLARQRTRDTLNSLSDRELSDIGLDRTDTVRPFGWHLDRR